MNATATPGIWEQTLTTGESMIVNENLKYIRVVGKNGNSIKYECPEGVLISDIEQIKQAHEGDCDRVMD